MIGITFERLDVHGLMLGTAIDSNILGVSMACNREVLKDIPLFSLLDCQELEGLAGQVDLKTFAARERIYRIGSPAPQAYVLLRGKVRVTTTDEDHQEVVVDEPAVHEFFG